MFDAENTALCVRSCWSGGVAVGGACSCGGQSAGGEASSGSRPGFWLLQGYTEQQEAQEQEQAFEKSDIKGEEGLLGGDLGAGALSEREQHQQQQQQQGWGPKDNLLPRGSALATRGDALCTPTALGVAAATSGSCKDHHYQQEEEGKERSLVPEPNGPFISLPAKSTRPLAIPSWSRRFIVEEPCCSSSASSSLDSSPPSFCSSSPPSFTLLPTPTYSEDHHDGAAQQAQATAAAAAYEAGLGSKPVVIVSLDAALDSLSVTVSQPSDTTGLPQPQPLRPPPPQRVGTSTTTATAAAAAAAAAANPGAGPLVCNEDSECPSGFEFLELAQLLLEEPMFRLGGAVGVTGEEGEEDAASAPAASSFVFSPPGVGGHGATENQDPQPVVPVVAAVDPHLSQQPQPQEGEPHTDHGGVGEISKAQRLEPDPSNNFGHHNSGGVAKPLNPTHPQQGGGSGKGVPLLKVPPMNTHHHPAPSHPSLQPSTVPLHHNYSHNQVQHFNPFHGSYATGFTGPAAPSPTIGSGSFGPYSHSSPSFAACPMGATAAYSNSHATMIASHPPSLHALTESNVLRLSINVPTLGMFYIFSYPETKVGQLLATIEGQVLELYRADIKAEKLQDQFKIDLPPSYTVGSMLKPDSVLTLDFSFRRSNSLPTRPNHRPPHGSYTLMLSASSPPSSPPSAASVAAPFHSSSSVDHNNDIHPSSEAKHNTNETEDILSVLQRSSVADISFAFTEQPPPHVYQNNEFSCTVCINSSLQLSSSESFLSRSSSSSADKKSKDEDANESKAAEKQSSSPISFSIPPLSSSSSTMIPTSFLPIDLQLWEHKDSGNVQLSEEDFSKRSLLMDRRKGFVIFFLKIRKNSYYGRTPFYLHMRGKDQWKDVPTVISEPIIVSAKKKRRRAGKKRNTLLDQHRGKKASDTQSDEEEEEAEEEEEHPSSSHRNHHNQYPSPYYPFPSSSPSELSKHVLPHMYPPPPPSHSHSQSAAYGTPVPYLGAPYYHPSSYYPPSPYTPYPLPPSNRLASPPYPGVPYAASPAPSHPHQPQSSHHTSVASSSHHNYPYYQPPYGSVSSSASTNNSSSLASALPQHHQHHSHHHRNNSDADPTNKLHSNDGSSNSGGDSGGSSASNNGRHSLPFAPQFQQQPQQQQQQGHPPPHKAA
ncbi:hypothetical protein QOT17_022059 [Balamuthia mandrillaris]